MSPNWYSVLPLLFLVACGGGGLQSAESLYRESEALGRRGFTRKAIEVADCGWRQWKDQPDAQWHWKFRLLEAELMLSRGSVSPALEFLDQGGGTPPSIELNAPFLPNFA